MKCDLCQRENQNRNRLCQPCTEAVQRLLTIQQRLEAGDAPKEEMRGWKLAKRDAYSALG